MKLTIRTLHSTTFKVDIEPNDLVKDLKAKIEKEQGKDYPISSQRLIYSGKILADESEINEYKIDEKKFVVLMIIRPPPVVKAPEATAEKPGQSSKSTDDAKSKADEGKSSAGQATKSTTTITTTTSSTPATTTPAATTTPSPSHQQQQTTTTGSTRPSLAASTEPSYPPMSDPNFAPRLAALMSQPHFRQMQDVIQQSPHLLSSTIEALAATDPDMYNFISTNPDAFVNALNHPPTAGSRMHSAASAAAATRGPNPVAQRGQIEQQVGGGGGGIGRQQPGMEQILGDGISEHDKQAIERLKELGFSEYLALQAYMACDKDEQLAANLLFQMDQ